LFTFESAVVSYTPYYDGGCYSNTTSQQWSVYCNITAVQGSNPSFSILITVAHQDKSVHKHVITLVEEGGLMLALQDGMALCPRVNRNSMATEILQKWTNWKVTRNWLWHIPSLAQDLEGRHPVV
jgi:hypothetical protein